MWPVAQWIRGKTEIGLLVLLPFLHKERELKVLQISARRLKSHDLNTGHTRAVGTAGWMQLTKLNKQVNTTISLHKGITNR